MKILDPLEEQKNLDDAFNQVIEAYTLHNPNGNFELIEKAYHFAKEAHQGIKRRSGEPYIMHPLAVALITVKEIGLGATSIASAFLHDVVEDTEYTVRDIETHFGSRVSVIVDGLTKLSEEPFTNENISAQAENFKKLLLTMVVDIRVIFIKIADRLHNMRTLSSMPAQKQYKISGETLYIYAPLAHRLGLYTIKTELEDLSFHYEHPHSYERISAEIRDYSETLDLIFKEFATPIQERLDKMGLKFTIKKRLKSVYSIWSKMQSKNIPFEEVHDLMGTRIVFEPSSIEQETSQCWEIYNAITKLYKLKNNHVRDWISYPKSNGYEALHLTVMGSMGRFIEVQIRSTRMDDIAEKGYAAHWKYKTHTTQETEIDKWVRSIREYLERPESNSVEFLDYFKLNLFSSEIFVFTPKGELKKLPWGATVLDFAYEVHTDLAIHCIGAKVNYKLVPASALLKGGDQVEILTSAKQKPQLEWLKFATTARSKSHLKTYFQKKRELGVRKGKIQLRDLLEELHQEHTPRVTRKILEYYKLKTIEEFYYRLSIEQYFIDARSISQIIKQRSKSKIIQYWNLNIRKRILDPKKNTKNEDSQQEDVEYIVSECCNPIPGDDIIGYKDLNNAEVTIHKRQCPIAIKIMSEYGDRIVNVSWKSRNLQSYLTTIKIVGIDRVGLVLEITKVISETYEVNMRSVHFDSNDGVFDGYIQLYVQHTNNTNKLLSKLIKIKGVKSAHRLENFEQ